MKVRNMKKKSSGVFLASPALAGFGVFYFIPFLIMVWYSVSFGIGKREFVGLKNYKDLMENEMFLLAVKNTCRFLLVSILVILLLSFTIAYFLKKLAGSGKIFEMIFFYPMVIPIASVVLIVRCLWSETGIVNNLIQWCGGQGVDWMHSSKAFWILCILYWWKYTGYHVLIFFTRLQMIPKAYYENASMDGAGPWAVLRYVVIPEMIPIILFNMLLAVMNAFKCYREAFLIGGNYPDNSIYLLQHFMNNSFESLNYQKISAASVMLMGGILLLILIGYIIYKMVRGGKYGRT
jgi:multiple sugar transport system permease protein